MLVGGDGWNESNLKREFSSNWDKNNSWRLIESGKNYKNVFRKFTGNSSNRSTDGQLNGVKLCGLIIKRQIEHTVREQLFSWVRERTGVGLNNTNYRNCRGGWQSVDDDKRPILTQFLSSTEAKSYFDNNSWAQYGDARNHFSLLTLLYLFSDSVANIKYDDSWSRISGDNGEILNSLFEPSSKFVYLNSSKDSSYLESVTLHSNGAWNLTFCREDDCKSGSALRVSVGREQFCILRDICLGNLSGSSRRGEWAQKWKNLHGAGNQTWRMLMGKGSHERFLKRLLLGLVAACFNEETEVSFSINADPEKGKMLLKKLN